jgi:3',5'-cyclic-AMP phosphodiesterase
MHPSVNRIAHVSDVHLLATQRHARDDRDLRVRFLSFGRALDAQARVRRFRRALDTAKRSGADHLVVSGDLTESGTKEQFDVLAEALHGAPFRPERITLVPGNHDAYDAPDAWTGALDGPLAAYRATSAERPGKVVEVGGLVIVPLDMSFHQPIVRSAGLVTEDALDALERRLADAWVQRTPAVIVQHHPPYAHASATWQWVDGLIGAARLTSILARFAEVHVLHGHLHRIVDRAIATVRTRVFGAPALVEDPDDAPPRVRLYDVRAGQLESVGLAA